jgi:O-antigen biosynthesis protein WbqP
MINRVFAVLLFILLIPLFLVISFIILFEDGFPVLLIQKRAGLNNKPFFIYKFRTMKKDTPSYASSKLNTSEYILNCGMILRKLSLDELPNLINIIKGEMVFVGPRPLIFEEQEILDRRAQEGIIKVKPGITGWAQINGRDAIGIEYKIALEKEYILRKSFMFDCIIILKTIIPVLSGKGVK